MKKLFCFTFIVSGALLAFASGIIGLGFGAIYLMGVIGTGGREAVGELVTIVVVSGIGFVIGFILIRVGRTLKESAAQ